VHRAIIGNAGVFAKVPFVNFRDLEDIKKTTVQSSMYSNGTQ